MGGKKAETFAGAFGNGGSKVAAFGFGKLNDSTEKKMFEASSFKIPAAVAATASSFSFSSTTCNKENSEPTFDKINSEVASKTTTEVTNEGSNTAYLSSLRALNEGVLKWIKKHLDDNININLNPVFDDYRKHFDELQKRYKPKFSTKNMKDIDESISKSCASSSEKQVKLSPSLTNLSSSSATTKSDKKCSESPYTSETSKSSMFSFGSGDLKPQESSTKLPFLSSEPPKFSFGSTDSKPKDNASLFSFSSSNSKPNVTTGFSFGGSTGSLPFGAREGSTPATATGTENFSFGSGGGTSGFSFGSGGFNAKPAEPAASEEAESDEPPKPEVVEVKEEGAVYEKKCKLFYKKDGNFTDKGVGTLYLKPVPDTNKTQLLIRAATNLGNVLLNILLNAKLPTQRMGKNNVLIVCVPNPPIEINGETNTPVSMLIRVKTGEDADELYEKVNEHKEKDSK